MKKVPLEKVQARLEEYVQTCASQSVIILNHGKPVAMLVGLEQDGRHYPRKLRDVLAHAWQEYKEQGGMSHDEFWEKIDESSAKPGSANPAVDRKKKASPKSRRPGVAR